jgi:excisionase family DNA binding protein
VSAAIELATASDVAELRAEVRGLRDILGEIREALPPRFVSVKDAAKALNCDPQTVVAMLDRGDLAGRRAGRRRLVDATSLRRAPR